MTKVHEENALKRDKAIQGLTSALLCKDNEVGQRSTEEKQNLTGLDLYFIV